MSNQKILSKLLAISKEIDYIQKDKKNTMQNYRYLSESKIKETFKNALEKNGVVFSYTTENVREYEISPTSKGTKQFVTVVTGKYSFSDVDSGEVLDGCWAGNGSDTGDKGIYKAITGGIKYVFNTAFLIPTGDDPEVPEPEEKGIDSKPKIDNKSIIEKENKPIIEKPKPKEGQTINESLIPQNKEEPKRKFTDEQKVAMKKVKEIFHIKYDSDLDKYVAFWSKKTNLPKILTNKEITPDNITSFCEFTLKYGSEVNPY